MIIMDMVVLAKAAGGDNSQGPFGGIGSMAVMIVGFFAIVYFMSIRPQKRKEREHQDLLSKLKAGDKIVTIGGICGEIFQVKDESFVIKIDEKAKIEITKGGIRTVVSEKDNEEKKS